MTGFSLPRYCRSLLSGLVLLGSLRHGGAQDAAALSTAPSTAPPRLAVQEARAKAVAWLIAHQSREGFWCDVAYDQKGGQEDLPVYANLMSAFSLMALASAGHFPDAVTVEGKAAARGLQYVLSHLGPEDQGYLGKPDRTRMYGHGIICLMLVRLLPHAPDDATRQRMKTYIGNAIQLCVTAQSVAKSERNTGGWRYEPNSGDSDTSVTSWQMMALLEAQKAGFSVPQDCLDKGLAFLQRNYRLRRDDDDHVIGGVFAYEYHAYSPHRHGTRAGLRVLQAAGLQDSDQARAALATVVEVPPPEPDGYFFYYGSYYQALTMFHSGGAHAVRVRQWLEKTLLPLQSPEGSWTPAGNEKALGTLYATSLALLSLGADPAAAVR